MLGLHDLAIGNFGRDQKFSQPAAEYEIVEVKPSDQGDISCMVVSVQESDLISNFSEDSQSTRREFALHRRSLQIVRIVHSDYSPLQIPKVTFIALFKLFKLDPYMLYLLSRNVYGFYRFEGAHGGEELEAKVFDSYFLNTSLSTILWSFDRAAMRTRALLLTKDNRGKRNSQERFQSFQKLIGSLKEAVHSPRLLAAVACIEWIQYIDITTSKLIEDIREVETKTGHGNWTTPGGHGNFNPDDISNSSRKIGRCLSTLSNQHRHLSIAASLCEFINQESPIEQSASSTESGFHTGDISLAPVAAQLSAQIKWAKDTVAYMVARAQAQSSVLLGLTSHHDATSNLRLATVTLELTQSSVALAEAAKQDSATTIALTGASLKLAEAAQRDSSAMKTIAVMTMAFLPATFFAALFAVPTLDWGAESVVGGRFWIYWAFTVPCTAGVFVVWMILPYCERLWQAVRGIRDVPDWGVLTGRRRE